MHWCLSIFLPGNNESTPWSFTAESESYSSTLLWFLCRGWCSLSRWQEGRFNWILLQANTSSLHRREHRACTRAQTCTTPAYCCMSARSHTHTKHTNQKLVFEAADLCQEMTGKCCNVLIQNLFWGSVLSAQMPLHDSKCPFAQQHFLQTNQRAWGSRMCVLYSNDCCKHYQYLKSDSK